MNTDRLTYEVRQQDAGREVQYLLRERLRLPSGTIKLLKYNSGILLDGTPVRGTARTEAGQQITALLNCRRVVSEIQPEPHELDILYEDDAFLVVNKPAATVMHPTCRHQSGTLTNYLLWHWQQKGIYTDVHLVGRLDKDTMGIVIAARNGYVQEMLRRQGENGQLRKHYLAAVSPPPSPPSGKIDAPILRDRESIIKRKVSEEGARAVTHYRTVYRGEDYAVVECLLETGRTHQIRVHCSHAGFPIIGDTLYGVETVPPRAPHQLLHAYKTELIHPVTGEALAFTAPLPQEWGRYAPHTWP